MEADVPDAFAPALRAFVDALRHLGAGGERTARRRVASAMGAALALARASGDADRLILVLSPLLDALQSDMVGEFRSGRWAAFLEGCDRVLARATTPRATMRGLLLLLRDSPGDAPGAPRPRPVGARDRAEDLALAHLTRALRMRRPVPSKAQCAKAAGCTRQAAQKWRAFGHTWKAAKAAEKSGTVRRGFRDRRTGAVDAGD